VEYGSRRINVLSRFGTDKMEGATGTHSLSAEDVAWLKPRAYELDSIAEGLIQRASNEEAESNPFSSEFMLFS
jgi:hypothetical protein